MYSILGGGGSPESKTARTVEEGYISRRRVAPARISVCACLMTLGGYFKHFPLQQLSALLQNPSGSDCPHENLFKIGLNSNTRQWHLWQWGTFIIIITSSYCKVIYWQLQYIEQMLWSFLLYTCMWCRNKFHQAHKSIMQAIPCLYNLLGQTQAKCSSLFRTQRTKTIPCPGSYPSPLNRQWFLATCFTLGWKWNLNFCTQIKSGLT